MGRMALNIQVNNDLHFSVLVSDVPGATGPSGPNDGRP